MKIKLLLLKLRGFLRRYLSQQISKSSIIGRNTQLLGVRNISIGENCTIGENTTLTVNNRANNIISLIIGKNTYIGRNNFFSVGKSIKVGPYCIFGNNCSLVSSNHCFDSPLIPYSASGFTNDKEIVVGTNCWFGINVTVIGSVNIGHGSIIGANSLINKDIPPFSMVVGNPAKIIKRFSFDKKKWIAGDIVNQTMYFDENVYLEFIYNKFGDLPVAYHSSSSQFGNI